MANVRHEIWRAQGPRINPKTWEGLNPLTLAQSSLPLYLAKQVHANLERVEHRRYIEQHAKQAILYPPVEEEMLKFRGIRTLSELRRVGLDGVGVVVAVINQEGQLYVVQETEPEKGRYFNLVSEKRREHETATDTVRGALIEEVGVETADANHFWIFPDVSYIGGAWFPHINNRVYRVYAEVVGVYYSGDKGLFESKNEVNGAGFMSLDKIKLISSAGLFRSATIPSLHLMSTTGAIGGILQAAQEEEGNAIFQDVNGCLDRFLELRYQHSDLFLN